ncbi:uncharacterized protein LOC131001240 [Salvia miltiorrhiza]|uniref:uncharacterized protein LOC131001240 n=1 Tax=Salvia miltiorrhiza TaxID=226208 RepID=UPI0025AC2D05|nr:uncharacterized protein LOC131001240 [Salvia miltiorrhiza]XP_057783551.1 uncharacterized protein LOC131001240 [Salvia miltiorrhiza]XP_057783552.1 uncharacterized protein LOC131001240 [Salvia miltiorrhiza]XP_057783553.1 uncharacterized protein LOC131001240 [Salvia miltiorrhiza]
MECPSTNLGKDSGEEENEVLCAIECLKSNRETVVPKRCRKNIAPGKTQILSIRRSRASATCRELFLQNIHASRNNIPKHIITFDEKYAIRCLQLIRNFAVRAAARNFSSKVDIFPDHTSHLAYIEDRSSSNMAIEYPLVGGTEVIVNSTGDWTIGTVSGSQTMINILKSPLLQQFGSLDANFVKTNFLGRSEHFDFAGSVKATDNVAPNVEKEVKFLDHRYASAPLHRREASVSSTSSSFSDQSSSSGSGISFQGMLQCTWKDGLPHHVFTVDDKREIYAADLSKVERSDDKGLDYLYTFHSRRNGKKERDIHDLESQSIAKMRVSSSIRFSSNDTEVRETQFILSIDSDNRTGEMQSSTQAHKKNKRLTKKMVDVFRPSQSYKQRSSSKAGAILEDTPLEPSEDVHDSFLDVGDRCAEYKYSPNLELAAIVVKDIYQHPKEAEAGGWGLKFLKKPGNKESLDATTRPKHSRNTGECSTSMDILIPAGIHGGPRTRVGGPSSIIERWKSGGHCDCGGWDVGCPLTIFNTGSGSTDCSSQECKSFDLFMQGSKQNIPIMKMVNIHKGLYYIHFQSSLSTLQSFAIAAALIHPRSPVIRSKVYRA